MEVLNATISFFDLEGDSTEKVKINNRIKAFEKALVEIIIWKIQWINNN